MDAMAYDSWYMRISTPFRGKAARKALDLLDKGLVGIIAACYIGLIAYLIATGDGRLARCILVPACAFAAVTVIRSAANRPRPYEEYDIDPLLIKDTHGKSMPSRHLASAVIIACTLMYVWPPSGIPAFAACAVVAFARIVGGVHYPSDIVAAMALSLVCAAVGYLLIP